MNDNYTYGAADVACRFSGLMHVPHSLEKNKNPFNTEKINSGYVNVHFIIHVISSPSGMLETRYGTVANRWSFKSNTGHFQPQPIYLVMSIAHRFSSGELNSTSWESYVAQKWNGPLMGIQKKSRECFLYPSLPDICFRMIDIIFQQKASPFTCTWTCSWLGNFNSRR